MSNLLKRIQMGGAEVAGAEDEPEQEQPEFKDSININDEIDLNKYFDEVDDPTSDGGKKMVFKDLPQLTRGKEGEEIDPPDDNDAGKTITDFLQNLQDAEEDGKIDLTKEGTKNLFTAIVKNLIDIDTNDKGEQIADETVKDAYLQGRLLNMDGKNAFENFLAEFVKTDKYPFPKDDWDKVGWPQPVPPQEELGDDESDESEAGSEAGSGGEEQDGPTVSPNQTATAAATATAEESNVPGYEYGIPGQVELDRFWVDSKLGKDKDMVVEWNDQLKAGYNKMVDDEKEKLDAYSKYMILPSQEVIDSDFATLPAEEKSYKRIFCMFYQGLGAYFKLATEYAKKGKTVEDLTEAADLYNNKDEKIRRYGLVLCEKLAGTESKAGEKNILEGVVKNKELMQFKALNEIDPDENKSLVNSIIAYNYAVYVYMKAKEILEDDDFSSENKNNAYNIISFISTNGTYDEKIKLHQVSRSVVRNFQERSCGLYTEPSRRLLHRIYSLGDSSTTQPEEEVAEGEGTGTGQTPSGAADQGDATP